MKSLPVIGLPVAVTCYAKAVDWVLRKARLADRAYAVEAANAHVAALSRHDSDFGESMKRFDLILPDGMPLVWAINAELEGEAKLKERVYGPTFMLRTMEATAGTEISHFLLGGSQSTLDQLERRLKRDFADTRIAATHSPPFGEWDTGEQQRIEEKIRQSGAKLIWVGLGCPKQEHWIARHLDQLPPGVYFGIGAAFAFHAGEVSQAPALLQKMGLEWLYRLLMEPRRLLRRYLVFNSLFIYHWLRDRMGH